MSMRPTCWVLFFEDVRYELEDKTSYIGSLGNDLVFSGDKLFLPQVCIAIFVRWPGSEDPTGWTVETKLPNGKQALPFPLPPKEPEKLSVDPDTGDVSLVLHTKVRPLVAPSGSKITVELVRGTDPPIVVGTLRFTMRLADADGSKVIDGTWIHSPPPRVVSKRLSKSRIKLPK